MRRVHDLTDEEGRPELGVEVLVGLGLPPPPADWSPASQRDARSLAALSLSAGFLALVWPVAASSLRSSAFSTAACALSCDPSPSSSMLTLGGRCSTKKDLAMA